MSEFINKEKVIQKAYTFTGSCLSQPILAGEIDGINTNYVIISKGQKKKLKSKKGQLVVFLFIAGNGCIEFESQQFVFHNIAVFVPGLSVTFSLMALDKDLSYLEIALVLKSSDKKECQKFKSQYPYFRKYSDCKTYKEKIKSEKTISRMIVPENIVPRLSIGSVQTTGPDTVAAHEHRMLEQLFYGLAGNSCFVFANGHERYFGENELLHIPLGSSHGVRVDEGKNLHYIWIDIFQHQNDMSYISDAHIINE